MDDFAEWQELPKGLAFLRLNSNQWPLAKMELAQPAEFWQGWASDLHPLRKTTLYLDPVRCQCFSFVMFSFDL